MHHDRKDRAWIRDAAAISSSIMPTYLRWKLTGATYFFTIVTHERTPWFRHPHHRRLLGASFRATRRRIPFEVDAVVLLPDHLHILIRPAELVDYSALWRLVKTEFTRRLIQTTKPGDAPCPRRRPGERSVWQRRFYEHTIRNEGDWGRHVDYIHWNPVKHGLVQRPSDWTWSSIHRYIRMGGLEPDWPTRRTLSLPDIPE